VETRLADWREGLPDLVGDRVTLRELRVSDAPTLHAELTTPQTRRFVWAPPPSIAAFERFIQWAHTERATGRYICYATVLRGEEHACSVFELRQLQPGFLRGEFGFVITPRLWANGVFVEAARILLDFAFNQVNVHRIEARAAVNNEEGNAAMEQLGARREGMLEEAFWQDDRFIDQYLWAILDSRWPHGNGGRPK